VEPPLSPLLKLQHLKSLLVEETRLSRPDNQSPRVSKASAALLLELHK
jgi:hypothetical protein